MYNLQKKKKGFTLIEVSVAGLLTIVVLGAIFGLQQIINQNQSQVLNHSIEIDIANGAMRSMVREIRNSHYGDNGAYLIESADSQTLIFYSDINLDGKT